MSELLLALGYGALAGAAIPAGALVARVERIRPQWLEQEFRHSVIAFGGGVLIAAVALVLMPKGADAVPPILALAAFAGGGALFALLERGKAAREGKVGAQFLAMLSDFVPEALALGAMLASGAPQAGLLAGLIALQNLPEGFNAYREQCAARGGRGLRGPRSRRILGRFVLVACLGPMAAGAGYLWLAGLDVLTGVIMLAAAGGILFLMFQHIAVEAHLKNRQAPSLAAIGGFGLGLLGHMLVG